MSQQILTPLNEVMFAASIGSLFPTTLRSPRTSTDNAMDYRNIMLLGAQGSGKTTTAQALALALGRKYGISNVVFAIQKAGIDQLLNVPTRIPAQCWVLAAEDITLARVPLSQINAFFQVRHIIQQHTGLREGMVVTVFNTHTFHGLNKDLRDTFNALIIKSVPTNPYDRTTLKRYFSPILLDEFSRLSENDIEHALVWTPHYPRGRLVHVEAPPDDAIQNVTIGRSIWSRLFGSGSR